MPADNKVTFGELDMAALRSVAKATDAVVLIAGRDDGAMYLLVDDAYEEKALEIVEAALESARDKIKAVLAGGENPVRPA